MKLSEMFETRKALVTERDSILAQDSMTVEVEARGHEVANELGKLDAEIRAAQVRERFASSSAIENTIKKTEDRSMDIRASKKYEDQFVNYLRTGQMPEQRELITSASSSILIPKVYQDAVLKYLSANSIMRNIADIRTGVQGYQTLRFSTLKTADYTAAWTQADTGTVATTAADPLFKEVPLAPVPCLPKTVSNSFSNRTLDLTWKWKSSTICSASFCATLNGATWLDPARMHRRASLPSRHQPASPPISTSPP